MSGQLQARHSGYFGYVLSETSLGIGGMKSDGNPFVDLPSGSVRVNSTFADAPASVANLSFGGNPFLSTSISSRTEQFRNQLGWFSSDNNHSLKLTTELRRDDYTQDMTTNQLGSFSFNSLSDLESGRPSAFIRQLSPRTRTTSAYTGAVALGDAWRPTPDLQLQYGLRVDGNRFNTLPQNNPEVERLFGQRNDYAPNDIYLSPRIGFSWMYGTAAQIAAFQGAVRGPRAVVRGGVGVFQNSPNAQQIGTMIDNTGLSSGLQQLVCVGGASPVPNWAAYQDESAIPTRCADGSQGTVFSNTAPNVSLFAKNYAAPRSLRGNLQWSGMILDNRFSTNIDATYSYNMNQASTYDLNFAPVQQFAIAAEDNRPVFARPTSIVSSTGTIAAGESRVSSSFNHVSQQRSDMASDIKQLTVGIRPFTFNSSFTWNLSYVYANAREKYRGFSSTSGDPREEAWGRSGFDSRHQVTYQLNYNAFDWVRLGWFGSFRSGSPFTPFVAGDINGDGYANDRAFIFDPNSANADSTVAAGMRSLLTTGSRSARDCLSKQLGHVADRNSCQGPWTTNATLTFSFNPIKVRMPQRANLSFSVSNPLGAADVLLHGEDNLHGWGQQFVPNNSLLSVRGFDPVTKKYKYDVNQRFGATALSQSAIRAPVTLTAMLRVDVGPVRERQDLTQLLDRGRATPGAKAPENFLRSFYGTGGVTIPMVQILRQADTLELTPEQADSIAILNRQYTIKLDSIWTPVIKYLAALPEKYSQDEAYDRYRTAREASVDAMIRLAPMIRGVLKPDQYRKLPTFVTPWLDSRFLASVRSGTAGNNLGGIMMGGLGAALAGGAGGGQRVEIRIGTP
jgi:hypothetical protein